MVFDISQPDKSILFEPANWRDVIEYFTKCAGKPIISQQEKAVVEKDEG